MMIYLLCGLGVVLYIIIAIFFFGIAQKVPSMSGKGSPYFCAIIWPLTILTIVLYRLLIVTTPKIERLAEFIYLFIESLFTSLIKTGEHFGEKHKKFIDPTTPD